MTMTIVIVDCVMLASSINYVPPNSDGIDDFVVTWVADDYCSITGVMCHSLADDVVTLSGYVL